MVEKVPFEMGHAFSLEINYAFKISLYILFHGPYVTFGAMLLEIKYVKTTAECTFFPPTLC